MTTVQIKYEGKKVRLAGWSSGARGGYSMTTYQMLQLGAFANKTVIARTRSGVGSDDTTFPPLKKGKVPVRINGRFVRERQDWAQWKAAHGLQPFRDMYGTGTEGGHMLDNSSVRYADDNTVKISFTGRMARIKALANEKRTPFYSFSDADAKKIFDYAAKLWSPIVKEFFAEFAGKKAA